MNVIWITILISSIVAMITSNPDGIVSALLNGSSAAVELALKLAASYGFWLGLFALMERSGISKALAKLLRPIIKLLFGNVDDSTEQYLCNNVSANLLGLGNAATPMGVAAVRAMCNGQKTANRNCVMLLVISATSLQIIPSTVISMRIVHGSAAPTAFLFPCIAATVTSTIIGICLVFLLFKLFPHPRKKFAERRLHSQKEAKIRRKTHQHGKEKEVHAQ